MSRFRLGTAPLISVALLLSACNGGSLTPAANPATDAARTLPQPGFALRRLASGKIQHVIIIVQENRSLNNLFYSFPGAKTASFGHDSKNQKVALKPIGLETKWDLAHNATGALSACNGVGRIPGTNCRMNGFDKEHVTLCGGPGQVRCPKGYPQYAYVPAAETKPYFDMGKQYVLADEMYSSDFDASSFVSHQYIIEGQAESSIDYPSSKIWGCPAGPGNKIAKVDQNRHFPSGSELACWNPKTLGDELDGAGLPWAYYASTPAGDGGVWSAYQAIRHIYKGPDWAKDVISPNTQFFNDVSSGNLRTVSWIAPTYENSDHAGAGSNTGPSWVASLVNAIGESQYWDSSAIFIFWDDYGGWYDPQPPAYVDYDGLGFRLPLLIISPYAKQGYVSHVHYEHGSILKFVEDQFGLARLAPSDTRANSPGPDCFDFKQVPRKFVPIQAPLNVNYFMHQPLDRRVPDSE